MNKNKLKMCQNSKLKIFTQQDIWSLVQLFFNLQKKRRICIICPYDTLRGTLSEDIYYFVKGAHRPPHKINLITDNYLEAFMTYCCNYDIVINLLNDNYVTERQIKIVQKMTDCEIFYLLRED